VLNPLDPERARLIRFRSNGIPSFTASRRNRSQTKTTEKEFFGFLVSISLSLAARWAAAAAREDEF
jgi:hypothetical protein